MQIFSGTGDAFQLNSTLPSAFQKALLALPQK
jgi:hypothetical protein